MTDSPRLSHGRTSGPVVGSAPSAQKEREGRTRTPRARRWQRDNRLPPAGSRFPSARAPSTGGARSKTTPTMRPRGPLRRVPAVPALAACSAFVAFPLPAKGRPSRAPRPGRPVGPRTSPFGSTSRREPPGPACHHFELTNESGRRRTLSGFSGVSAVRFGGRQLGISATANDAHARLAATSGRGATASAVPGLGKRGTFRRRDAESSSLGTSCAPPGPAASKVVPFPFPACTGVGPGFLYRRSGAEGLG